MCCSKLTSVSCTGAIGSTCTGSCPGCLPTHSAVFGNLVLTLEDFLLKMSMFGKNKFLQTRTEQSPTKRFKANVSDLLLQGSISGQRAASLFTDAADSEAQGLDGLSNVPQSSHALRDLQRKLTKNTPWPPLFPARVRMRDIATEKTFVETLFMLLPHELCHQLWYWNQDASQAMLQNSGLNSKAMDAFKNICAQHHLDIPKVFPLGFWIDGVPVKWDRSESLIVFTLNLPGQVDAAMRRLRIPLTVINKKFLAEETTAEIMEILAWSFKCLFSGHFPAQPLPHQELFNTWRSKRAGKPLGAYGLLVEIRGDWEAYKNVFGLAGWKDKYCCYRCWATPADIRDPSLTAAWRSQRKDLYSHFLHCKFICPLFSLPGVNLDTFVIDWLHCMDLGMAADFAGNLLYHILDKFPGASQKERCKAMHRHLQAWYRHNTYSNKLTSLTPGMLRKESKKGGLSSPKLRASAGEMRSLVPWLCSVASASLDTTDLLENAMLAASKHLLKMYQCLDKDSYNPGELAENCRKFLLFYVSLEDNSAGNLWKFKPKFHMAQELCEFDQVNPSLSWVYRDEDYGGSIAASAKHRGGLNSATATSRNVLTKFISSNQVPTWPVH